MIILPQGMEEFTLKQNQMKFKAIISLVKLLDNDLIIIPEWPHGLPLQLLLIKLKTAKIPPNSFLANTPGLYRC